MSRNASTAPAVPRPTWSSHATGPRRALLLTAGCERPSRTVLISCSCGGVAPMIATRSGGPSMTTSQAPAVSSASTAERSTVTDASDATPSSEARSRSTNSRTTRPARVTRVSAPSAATWAEARSGGSPSTRRAPPTRRQGVFLSYGALPPASPEPWPRHLASLPALRRKRERPSRSIADPEAPATSGQVSIA